MLTLTQTERKGHATTNTDEQSKGQLLIVDLDDFEIYRSPHAGYPKRKFELTSLHNFGVPLSKKLCFDGYLCTENVKHYVQGLDMQDLSIEGYGDTEDPQVVSYIRSELGSKDTVNDVWYRLKKPAPNYRRFHESFLWVAQLAKHVIDYLESQPARSVGLENFRKDFHQWLVPRFIRNEDFQKWHLAFRAQVDFRVGVNAHIEFIYAQAFNLASSKQLLAHPIWGECMARGSTSVKPQKSEVQQTLATDHVYESFKHMYFGKHIHKLGPSKPVLALQKERKRKLGFPECLSTSNKVQTTPPRRPHVEPSIQIGDVVAIDPNEMDQKNWRNSAQEWLAYVQDIALRADGTSRLSVIWLYRSCETNIYKAKYPFDNELFLSDNCNCGPGVGELLLRDVRRKYTVQWSPTRIPTSEYFIRQTYMTEDSAFVSLREEHKTCVCRRAKPLLDECFSRGDTFYVSRRVKGTEILDPAIIWAVDASSNAVTVRKLLRLGRDCADLATKAHRRDTAPNELVLTDEYEEVNALRIKRRCSIRFVSKHALLQNQVPSPYDRDGVADLWFLSMEIVKVSGSQRLTFLSKLPEFIHEGPDFATTGPKLKGLSIFSGGGSLDRGLETGGGVEFQTVVDFSAPAIHTQRANSRCPATKQVFLGSVDDCLKAALAGNNFHVVARVGEVEFIAAGSPCPGKCATKA